MPDACTADYIVDHGDGDGDGGVGWSVCVSTESASSSYEAVSARCSLGMIEK